MQQTDLITISPLAMSIAEVKSILNRYNENSLIVQVLEIKMITFYLRCCQW